MLFAIDTPNFGDYSDPRLLAELAQEAQEAQEAGWHGFFLWDHIGADWPFPVGDPWVALSATAMTTQRIKLGPLVTPLPRRRPWKLAREMVTLDHLSGGRLILGVGIGSDSGHEYSCFAEATDDRQRGATLDEGLEVLTKLWSGEPFHFERSYYRCPVSTKIDITIGRKKEYPPAHSAEQIGAGRGSRAPHVVAPDCKN